MPSARRAPGRPGTRSEEPAEATAPATAGLPQLELRRWYVDASPGHGGVPGRERFLVLAADRDTVGVVDEHGVRRTVNRMLFESQMTPCDPPVARQKGARR